MQFKEILSEGIHPADWMALVAATALLLPFMRIYLTRNRREGAIFLAI